ncbi:MAG TPA: adenosine deaminase [Opitutaceae bacterium]|jgi:adenosine deaminase
MESEPLDRLLPFILALPKTETHLHLEGALPYELLVKKDPITYPPNPDFRKRSYRYESFPKFEETLLRHALPWFTSADRYHDAAKVIFAGHVRQNVRYVETSFHLHVTEFIHVPGPEIIDAILSAAPPGLEVRVFAGMLRSAYSGPLRDTIDRLENWDSLSGVDLHGFELMPTEPWSARIWKRIRASGKVTKCHAGEFDGAPRVREAIQELGVRRVQHGVRAAEDPAVVSLAASEGATFDVCPISNVGLQVVPDMASHPLRRLMAAGVNCTVSTDDPLCFANSLTEEYSALAGAGFSRADLARVARNGWAVADVPHSVRDRNLAAIDAALAA